jgi:hypothetical protein
MGLGTAASYVSSQSKSVLTEPHILYDKATFLVFSPPLGPSLDTWVPLPEEAWRSLACLP